MGSTRSQYTRKTWTRGSHFISTDPTLISIPQLITVFDSPECHWAKSMPEEGMKEMLENSLNFGLYEGSAPKSDATSTTEADSQSSPRSFIGIARCITDYTTFLYLTDVWVDSQQQGAGLGRWLISVVQEVIDSMPYLRRSMLFTGDWERSVPFYEKLMKMEIMETKRGHGVAIMEMKGEGHPMFKR